MGNWTEADIRAELARLDALTGLSGAALPIRFGRARRTLGMFMPGVNGQEEGFRFSLYYFDNPQFSRAEALDVIRHEYAHYMDWELNGACGHGKSWKRCCQKVGACPTRLYTEQFARGARYLQRQEELSRNRNTFRAGQKLAHPDFGVGVIQAVSASGSTRLLTVRFDRAVKVLEAGWAEAHCGYTPAESGG